MRYSESDIRKNSDWPKALAQVLVGSSYDARWASVPADIDVIDRLAARVDHERQDREDAR